MKIYHNPRCSKSRTALGMLEEAGVAFEAVEYLRNPPSEAELEEIVGKLGVRPEQLVRKGEEVYKTKFKGKQMSDSQWIAALAQNPILIERPIVVSGRRAVIGRPPENVQDLLNAQKSGA